jgi:GNAT superfamily N-acetyltransferase
LRLREGTVILIRPYVDSDSISEITSLLHRAYKEHADMGMLFLASHQDEAVTLERIKRGTCFIAELDGKIVGTITLYDAAASRHYNFLTGGCYFGQFAVEPELQSSGVGSMLLEKVEMLAREWGLKQIALDTSEDAKELIKYYEHRGYKFLDYVQWPDVNYRSVRLVKELS